MSLQQYRQKRRFKKTPEPAGSRAVSKGQRFVVQKHAASHLHYDFRLEMGGTLKSWAVPKGPSSTPHKTFGGPSRGSPDRICRLRGDHSPGRVRRRHGYGLGPRRPGLPKRRSRSGNRAGESNSLSHGEKLKGSWALVRTARGGSRKPQWLLIKHRDAAARPSKGDILDKATDSAETGRTLEEIAEGARTRTQTKTGHRTGRKRSDTPDVWHSHRPSRRVKREPGPVKVIAAAKRPRMSTAAPASWPVRKRRPMPKKPQAELATLVHEPPKRNDWLHEIKFDGYRMLCCVEGRDSPLYQPQRPGLDGPLRLAWLEAAAALPVEQAILDGEVVVLDAKGVSQFQLLQNAMSTRETGHDATALYYAFDLIYLDGYDLSGVPLEMRKSLLQALLEGRQTVGSRIRLSEHVVGNGRGVPPSGLPRAARRNHLQAAKQPLSSRTRNRLAQMQVPPDRGIRDRRLHAARRACGSASVRSSGIFPAGQEARLRRPRGHRVRHASCSAT